MLAVGEHAFGNLEPRTVRMATGFAGGVGETYQELCGALSGGVMVIGGLFGREHFDEDDWPALTLAARYRERFLSEFGYTECGRLREQVVYAPDGLGSCSALVERAASILLNVLDETM